MPDLYTPVLPVDDCSGRTNYNRFPGEVDNGNCQPRATAEISATRPKAHGKSVDGGSADILGCLTKCLPGTLPGPSVAWSHYFDSLAKLERLADNWDSYGAPAPNGTALALAQCTLEKLLFMNFEPGAIVPSGDGGVGITFRNSTRYASVEFYNDGEIVTMIVPEDAEPEAWLVPSDNHSVKGTLELLREFIEYGTRPIKDK